MITTELEKKNVFFDFEDYFKSSNKTVNIDINEFLDTFKHQGKIEGYTNICSLENLIEDVSSNINFKKIKTSKSIRIIFIYNQKMSLFTLQDLLSKIYDTVSAECEIIFGTHTDNSLTVEEVKYFIISSGIQNDNSYDNSKSKLSKKLIDENRTLKLENERLKNTLMSLKFKY